MDKSISDLIIELPTAHTFILYILLTLLKMASKNPKKVFGLICGFRGESGCVLLFKNPPFCCGGNCEEKSSSSDGVWKEPEPKKLLGCLVFESCVYDQSNICIYTKLSSMKILSREAIPIY